jgi:hypothetical protein
VTTRTKPQYDVDFHYTRGGMGVGICTYRYRPFSYFSSSPHESTMAFMESDGMLLVADGDPHGNLDSGYHDDDWQSVERLIFPDSPEDGTIEDSLEDEYPGLLAVVRDCLKNCRSQKLALVSGRPIKVPPRGKRASDVTRTAQLVRAFLGLRGKDDAGHSVIVHEDPYTALHGTWYQGTIVYETRSWAHEFLEWYEGWLAEPPQLRGGEEPDPEVLSSYEIGVLR